MLVNGIDVEKLTAHAKALDPPVHVGECIKFFLHKGEVVRVERNTTPQCEYIGGHKPGYDPECAWCRKAMETN